MLNQKTGATIEKKHFITREENGISQKRNAPNTRPLHRFPGPICSPANMFPNPPAKGIASQ
ncbi:MAG TPA: hypothetical protein VFF11_02590 [Candidatus Binatia bacterium]|nr:hypothetical protein [Candidatus Binatia bacterium]